MLHLDGWTDSDDVSYAHLVPEVILLSDDIPNIRRRNWHGSRIGRTGTAADTTRARTTAPVRNGEAGRLLAPAQCWAFPVLLEKADAPYLSFFFFGFVAAA